MCYRFIGGHLAVCNCYSANCEFEATMKKITHKDYDRLKETFYGDALRNIPKKGKDGSGGNYYLTKLSYLGQRYAGDVFREYFSGRIDNVRASEMLNSKIDHLPKLESAYFRGLK